MIDHDLSLPRWATTTGWGLAGIVGVLWLLLLALLVVGFVLGTPGDGQTRTVEFDEPTAEVVADAVSKFRARDYTLELWFRNTNYNRGTRSGGIILRADVERSAGEIRLEQWRGALTGTETTLPSDPHTEIFGAGFASWRRPTGAEYWVRTSQRGGVSGSGDVVPFDPARIRGTTPTVVTDNETVLVVRFDDASALTGQQEAGNTTARVVITKGSDPHVRQVRTVTRTRTTTRTWLYRVSNWETAEARRPAAVPAVTLSELLARIGRGLGRLF